MTIEVGFTTYGARRAEPHLWQEDKGRADVEGEYKQLRQADSTLGKLVCFRRTPKQFADDLS